MKRLQLVVDYLNGQTRYYPVNAIEGWRIDASERLIIIGKFPRKHIPLDTVASFDIEEVPPCRCQHVVAVIGPLAGRDGSEAGKSAPAAQSGDTGNGEEVPGADPNRL